MPEEIKVSKTTLAVIALILLLIGVFYYQYYYAAPPAAPPKYTTGLTVKFKIYDAATYALITSNVAPTFYSTGVDPLGTRTFTTKPVAVAAYDSTLGAWSVPLDAGSYVILIKDTAGSKTLYAETYTVTVSGTDSEDKEVWLEPSTLNVYSRATLTIASSILAYNDTSGAYDISVSNINITAYTKWIVTYSFTISDSDTSKIIKAGRLYLTKITGLTPTSASLDGATAAVNEDTDASDDGMTGYYIPFDTDWEVGEIHRLDIYFEAAGASTGTLTLKAFEYYECLNTNLRWWSDQTSTISVVS